MSDDIINKALRLIKKYKTSNPYTIAEGEGAEVAFYDIGSLKGMYINKWDHRYIVINDALDEYVQKLICAHELAHDQLHRDIAADSWLREFMLYDMSSRIEYEANLFAAELILLDSDVIELCQCGYDIHQIAKELCTDVNLVAIKLGTLAKKGYDIRKFEFRDDFLK
ncbi:MAG: ImmA/IrrE family metallo-endopeptidase [Christensenellaceae bacterium]|nr:ImmA/IrrE family metallo-endopeptidase [Christensenellaceae bacterium]